MEVVLDRRFKFSEWVKSERIKRGWSQAELARRAGINNASVSNWEKGVNDISLTTLAEVARAFDYRIKISEVTK